MTDNIMSMVLDQMKKKDITKRAVYNYLSVSPNTLDNYFNAKYPITLTDFLKICELLKLNPSFFFDAQTTNLVNEGNLNYATGKNINQSIGASASHDNKETEILRVENEGLKKENALLREMIEMYKNK